MGDQGGGPKSVKIQDGAKHGHLLEGAQKKAKIQYGVNPEIFKITLALRTPRTRIPGHPCPSSYNPVLVLVGPDDDVRLTTSNDVFHFVSRCLRTEVTVCHIERSCRRVWCLLRGDGTACSCGVVFTRILIGTCCSMTVLFVVILLLPSDPDGFGCSGRVTHIMSACGWDDK